jgi:phosphate transport system permease protein
MTTATAAAAAGRFEHFGLPLAARSRRGAWLRFSCYGFTALAVGFLVFLVGLFVYQSLPVWRHSGWHYLTDPKWYYRKSLFGSLSMVYGTIAVAVIAMALAVPVGLGAAIFTSEYLRPGWRLGVKIVIELLAGIPSVVYGLLGILFLRDWIYQLLTPLDPISGDSLLTAGILLAVMVLPTIMTLSDDALQGVARLQRTAARGLGLTRAEAVFHVTLPQARPGLIAAALLGLGRALGETIAVFLVVGRQDNRWPERLLTWQPLTEAGQTLTSKLGGSETNIAYGNPLHWAAIVALGLLLLAMVGVCTLAADRLTNRL